MNKFFLLSLSLFISTQAFAKTLKLTVRNLDCASYHQTTTDFKKRGHITEGECSPTIPEITFPITLDGVKYKNYRIKNDKTYVFNNVGLGHHRDEIELLLSKEYTIYDHKFGLTCYHGEIYSKDKYTIKCCENSRLVWDLEVIELDDYQEELEALRGSLNVWMNELRRARVAHDEDRIEEAKRMIRNTKERISEYDNNNPM